jgi:hypothetical protein
VHTYGIPNLLLGHIAAKLESPSMHSSDQIHMMQKQHLLRQHRARLGGYNK